MSASARFMPSSRQFHIPRMASLRAIMANAIPEMPTVGADMPVKVTSAAAVALKYATGILLHLGLKSAIA